MASPIHIAQPVSGSRLIIGTVTTVGGSVDGKGLPEPTVVDSVTVQIGGQAPVEATLKQVPARLPHPPGWVPSWLFQAQVQVPGPAGAVPVIVRATYDSGQRLSQTVSVEASPPPVKAPADILQVQYTNPAPPSDPDWATTIAGSGTFPGIPDLPSGIPGVSDLKGPDLEWKQVLAPEEDYDQFSLVGAAGWVLDPNFSGGDVPFDHPFGPAHADWEFDLLLDDKYAPLLALGNRLNDHDEDLSALQDAQFLNLPAPAGGFLGVEIESAHVPTAFWRQVGAGDRMALFGRWIVDCGHQFVYSGESTSYRSEIHPPLVMAAAKTGVDEAGSPVTRVLFSSRPYLTGQRYTVDTSTIYDDGVPDDGPLASHLLNEVIKVNTFRSTLVEAHPKIKSHPFWGAHLLHFAIRPPSPLHAPPVPEPIVVSFQFTIRGGCAVQVTSATSATVDVFVTLSDGGYTPPPLPTRRGRRYSREELAALTEEASADYLKAEEISAAIQVMFGDPIGAPVVVEILNRGIETDEYDPLPDVNILDASHAVVNVSPPSVAAGQGVVQDDSQPYPFFGWLEARFQRPNVHP